MLAGCVSKLDITPQEVEAKINASLKVGDSSEIIEAYFKQEGLGFSYDKHESRYQSIIRHPKSDFHAIIIYIYIDNQKGFLKAEAHDSYTFL
jgi:hypothetical protein